jgi:hypothetical protein
MALGDYPPLLLRQPRRSDDSSDGVLLGTKLAPGALGNSRPPTLPPCSVGYPGRSREWLRPRLFRRQPLRHIIVAESEPSHLVPVIAGTAAASEITNTPKGSRRVALESPGPATAGALPLSACRQVLRRICGAGHPEYDAYRQKWRTKLPAIRESRRPPSGKSAASLSLARLLLLLLFPE